MTSQAAQTDDSQTTNGSAASTDPATARHDGSPDATPPDPHAWRVHLSGGGVRATLCSVGALWQFRGRFPESTISDIVSVSGGTLASAALLRDQPDPAGMDDYVRRVFHRVRMNVSNAASVVALAGLVAIVLGAALADRSWFSGGDWKAWTFTGLVVVWLAAAAIVKVLALSSVVLAVALLSVEYDLAPVWEGRLAAGALALVGVGVLGIWIGRRWRDPRGRGLPRRRRRITDLQAAGLVGTVLGLGLLMWLLLVDPRAWLVHGVLTVVSAGVVSLVMGPLLLRGYLGRLVGVWAVETLGRTQDDVGLASWAARHVVITTSLRDEVPAFFVVDVQRPGDASVGPPLVLVDEVTDGARRVAMNATDVRVVTMLQASAAAFPQFAPTVAFGTRTRWRPPINGKEVAVRAPALPLFADGGLRGTLGTQYTRAVENEVDRLASGTRTPPRPARTLVVDATRRRAQMFWWPALLIPKYGASLIQLRLVQAMLSALVDEERTRLEQRHGGPGRTWDADGRTANRMVVAAATGACFMKRPSDSDDPVAAFARLMYETRRVVDRQTGWFPRRRRAATCVLTGALAVIDAVELPERKLDAATVAVNRLERLLGVKFGLEVANMQVPAPGDLSPRDDPWAAREEATGRRRPWRVRVRRPVGAARWLAFSIAATLVLASNVVDDLPIVGGCDPVCADGPRHEALADPFVAVSHQGVGGGSNEITIEGFREARALGFRHLETDVGLVEADALGVRRLVAIHKNSSPSVEEAGRAPAIADLLSDSSLSDAVWHLELNSADTELVAAFGDAIVPAASRVCVHFGGILRPDKVAEVRAELPPDTCVCASVPERMKTADFPLARFVSQAIVGAAEAVTDSRARVDCAVVYEGSADGRDATDAGEGVVVMSWANGAGTETPERLRRLVCDGFGGIITNDPGMLREVLIDTGVWDEQNRPTGEDPKGCVAD